MKSLIIIPTFNAQDKILDVLSDLSVNVPEADLLVIDHGSTDRTRHIIRNNNINHLIMPLETSYYNAMSLGMTFAHDNNYDIAIEWDDKRKFQSTDIKYFISTIERRGYDFVLGSRFVDKKAPYQFRRFGTRTLRRVIKMTTGKTITDPTLRFRTYGRKAIKWFVDNEGMSPAPDSIAKAIKDGLTFTESQTSLYGKNKKQMHASVLYASGEIFRWVMWILFVLPFRKNTIKKKNKTERGINAK